ncbi:MAG: FGGY family carbohydrate kinase [Treponema sp.]
MKYAIIVIDIGMTNKKVAVYSDELKQIEAEYKSFEPVYVKDSDGMEIPAHDLSGMEKWFKDEIKTFAKKYNVKAISVTTHGATFVCVDENGKLAAPCVYYTYEPGEKFQEEFYSLCGARKLLQKKTFSPAFSAMINPAKGIYFLQQKFYEQYKNTKLILCFPQYWGFLLTGSAAVEPTYIGSHTLLWDHKKSTWSSVVDTLKIREKLPARYAETYGILGCVKPDVADELGLSKDTVVTLGVHDSNASLLPYLAEEKNDFVLNSTGTWCVSMHPEKKYHFSKDDFGKIVYFNQSALHTPVKTSIFLGGMEFDTYRKLYEKISGKSELPNPNDCDVQKILTEKKVFLLPEVVEGSGQFTSSKPGIFEDEKFYSLADLEKCDENNLPEIIKRSCLNGSGSEFFALLDISLAIQSFTSLRRAGLRKRTSVFTEGGFRKNEMYNRLLASVLPENNFYLTNISEATAFGSAMTAVMALEKKPCGSLADKVVIEKRPVTRGNFSGFEEYMKMWIKLAEK